MKDRDLLARLNALGFPLFNAKEAVDANMTLAQVVKSNDVRLKEGFPLLLANSVKQGLFDYSTVMRRLKKTQEKKTFKQLLLVSLALYKTVNVKFSWADKLFKTAKLKEADFNKVCKQMKQQRNEVAYAHMSTQRLAAVFKNYFQKQAKELGRLALTKEEFNLEYAMSRVFSPKQKELFVKKLNREKLTKTEREYFSRVVKKKVVALANSELHRLSRHLLE